MSLLNSSALIVLEVNEPNKAPDLRYITVATSDLHQTDLQFESSAIAYFQAGNNYPTGTKFVLKGVQRFESIESYLEFFKNQLADYLESLK